MKICAISDTHGRHHDLDLSKYPADVLVFAGDWTRGLDKGLSETSDFLAWFAQQPYKHLMCIAGSHEKEVEFVPGAFQDLLLMYPNIIYLNNETTMIDGINFFGSPYSNEFYGWAFMEEDHVLRGIWNQIPNNTDVLITHGPAYGCNDQVKHSYGRDPHVGSKSLHKRKLALQDTLKAHISGHIHEAYGMSESHICINVCASVLDEQYNLVNAPIILEIT